MTEAPGGRSCASCSKVVVDLTDLTDTEAAAVLAQRQPGEQLCARVNPGQLRRISPQVRRMAEVHLNRKHFRLLPVVLLGMIAIQAQAPLLPAEAPLQTEWSALPNQPLPPLLPGDFPVNIEFRDFQSKALIQQPLRVYLTYPNGDGMQHLVKNGRLSFIAKGFESYEFIKVMVSELEGSHGKRGMHYYHSSIGKRLTETKHWVIEVVQYENRPVPEMGDMIDPHEGYH